MKGGDGEGAGRKRGVTGGGRENAEKKEGKGRKREWKGRVNCKQ